MGIKRILLIGIFAGAVASIVAFFSPSFALLTIAYIAYGFAIGAAFTSLTTLYSHLPEKYRDFGLFHAFFGIGGIIAPLITGFVQDRGMDFHLIFMLYAILMLASFFVFLWAPGIENRTYKNGNMGAMMKTLLGPLLIMGIAVMGTYAATEIGIVTYAGNQHISTYQTSPAQASWVLSGFWVLFTFARVITDPLARRFGTQKLVMAMVALALVALIGWIFGAGLWTFLIIGLALGPIFPAMQKFINNHLPDEKKGLFNGGTYASLGAITSLVLPLMGSLGEGGIQRAFIPSVLCLIALLFLVPVVVRRLNRQGS
jgi:MFS family permease